MSDYISRDVAIAKMREYKTACEDIENFKEARIADRTIQFLENIPVADVREVRRGKWTFDDFDGDGFDYQCSCCEGYSRSNHDFCPNCGADMRKKIE